jgi:hypothetical protein
MIVALMLLIGVMVVSTAVLVVDGLTPALPVVVNPVDDDGVGVLWQPAPVKPVWVACLPFENMFRLNGCPVTLV